MQGIANAGFGIFEFAGITRNLDGKSWFDRMTEHCTGQYSFGQATPQPNHGTCLYVDGNGDKVMIDWTYVMPAGTKQIVAGTGKYAASPARARSSTPRSSRRARAWIRGWPTSTSTSRSSRPASSRTAPRPINLIRGGPEGTLCRVPSGLRRGGGQHRGSAARMRP